ncbi:MAG: CarD family transcriptional regulator, partial [Oscillospiraceae bacterium]
MAETIWTKEALPVFRAIDAGQCPVLASGIGPASRAHLAAAIRQEMGFPLFVVCPDDQSAEIMQRDLCALLGEEVTLLGSRDLTFYPAESAGRAAEQKRLAALDALASGQVTAAVCTVSALLQRTLPPETLRACAVTIADGQEVPMEEIEKALLRCGYVHRLQVEAPGQYSRRGGILDFFSPAHPNPVRMEFWGDQIDSMGLFDVNSQRRIENIPSVRILPAAETLPALYEGGESALADALSAAAVKAGASKKTENQSLARTLRADGERLRETGALAAADRYMGLVYPRFACGLDYIPADALVFLDQPVRAAKLAEDQMKLLNEDLKILLSGGSLMGSHAEFRMSWSECAQRLLDFPVVMGDSFTSGRMSPEPRAIVGITAKQLPSYGGSLETACEDVKHYVSSGFSVVVLASDERRANALRDFFADRDIGSRLLKRMDDPVAAGDCGIAVGALSGGFEYPLSRLAVLTDAQLLQPGLRRKKKKNLPSNRKKLESYADLSVGDLVVHEYHGIGRFAGIVKMKVDGAEKDYVKICYAGTDTLYVPATQLDLVSKYIGAGEDKPVKLSRMGGSDWTRAKSRAKAAAKEMAGELIQLYAQRKRLPGHAFAPDSPWQTEFEESFGYQETDDQLRCIAEIKKDMESSVPMDRLLCGDVGYGKTEVALRAVMKC